MVFSNLEITVDIARSNFERVVVLKDKLEPLKEKTGAREVGASFR